MSYSCRGFSFSDTTLRCRAFIFVHYLKICSIWMKQQTRAFFFSICQFQQKLHSLPVRTSIYLFILQAGYKKEAVSVLQFFTPPTYFDRKPFENLHTEQSHLESLLWNMHLSSHHGEQVGM